MEKKKQRKDVSQFFFVKVNGNKKTEIKKVERRRCEKNINIDPCLFSMAPPQKGNVLCPLFGKYFSDTHRTTPCSFMFPILRSHLIGSPFSMSAAPLPPSAPHSKSIMKPDLIRVSLSNTLRNQRQTNIFLFDICVNRICSMVLCYYFRF